MEVKYEHLLGVLLVFLVISGLWFWLDFFNPIEGKKIIYCYGDETDFVPLRPLEADYWCKMKNTQGNSFFLKKI